MKNIRTSACLFSSHLMALAVMTSVRWRLAAMTAIIVMTSTLSASPPLDLAEVVRRLDAASERRQQSLAAWSSERRYTVTNTTFRFERQLDVEMRYRYPDTKSYTARGKGASGLIYSKVFKQILDSEVNYTRPGLRLTSAITSRNYRFELQGEEDVNNESCFRLKLIPRRKSKFLVDGVCWVSRNDFEIVRLDAHPAEKPSFWVVDVQLVRNYRKVQDFWMPASDRTVSHIRLFGETRLEIDYLQYNLQVRTGENSRQAAGPQGQ